MLRRRVLLAAILLGAPGCGGGAKAVEVNRNDVVPVQLDVTITGDLGVEFHGKVPSRFILRRTASKNEDARNAQVVGTEPAEPVPSGGGSFVAGAAITPFWGDRAYDIQPGSPFDIVGQQGGASRVTSSVKVQWWARPDAEPDTYLRRVKPCQAVVRDGGTRGTVTCSDLTDETRTKHIALTLAWVAPG